MKAVSTEAQFPERVYPIMERTDEMRTRIDVRDGSVDDWREVLGEPTLTPVDLVSRAMGIGVRPIFVGLSHLAGLARWRQPPFRSYRIDRRYNQRACLRPKWRASDDLSHADLSVWLFVDGDRSGGSYQQDEARGLEYPMQQARGIKHVQEPIPTAATINNLVVGGVSLLTDWVHRPPFADGDRRND